MHGLHEGPRQRAAESGAPPRGPSPPGLQEALDRIRAYVDASEGATEREAAIAGEALADALFRLFWHELKHRAARPAHLPQGPPLEGLGGDDHRCREVALETIERLCLDPGQRWRLLEIARSARPERVRHHLACVSGAVRRALEARWGERPSEHVRWLPLESSSETERDGWRSTSGLSPVVEKHLASEHARSSRTTNLADLHGARARALMKETLDADTLDLLERWALEDASDGELRSDLGLDLSRGTLRVRRHRARKNVFCRYWRSLAEAEREGLRAALTRRRAQLNPTARTWILEAEGTPNHLHCGTCSTRWPSFVVREAWGRRRRRACPTCGGEDVRFVEGTGGRRADDSGDGGRETGSRSP